MAVRRWFMPVIALVLMVATVAIGQLSGAWVSTGRQAVSTGALTPDGVKGWMTLQEVADGLGLPVADVVALTGAAPGSEPAASTALKDLEAVVPGFEVTAFRERLAAALDPSATAAPSPAPTGTGPATPVASPSPSPSGTGSGAASGVTGQMTLAAVAASTGIPVERIIAKAGLPADVRTDVPLRELKDLVSGFEVATVRDAVAALQAGG